MKQLSAKDCSVLQEKQIANFLGGAVTPGSGGTKFGGGDIITDTMLIEAKTVTTEKLSISLKKEWLDKVEEQAFEQGKYMSAVAVRFEPHGTDYYVVNETVFKSMLRALEERENNEYRR